ncbi:MAG: 6-phospho-beta-glucosidase, partial [Actinobacteria bacterium]|nr:6-phospho-beta-glucosidase [Actinomycetota bacterium]
TGADFVFAAIRVGGLDGRCCDEHVALDLGVLGQETTGPGGLAYAIRTIPQMLHVAHVMQEVSSPRAYLLNFTNPAGIITEAVQTVLGDRVLGICDTPSGLGRRVALALGKDASRVQMDYVGLNHLGWMRRVLVDGQDLLPQLLADDAALATMEETEVFGTPWLRTLGVIPNEYLYYYYNNKDAVAAIQAAKQTRGDFLKTTQTLFYDTVLDQPDAGAYWRAAVDERGASYMAEAKGREQGDPNPHQQDEVHDSDPADEGYAGVALKVMKAISRNERSTMILNVRNRGTVHALPEDAVIEVPTMVDANGVHPLALETQPTLHQLGLLAGVKSVERLVIEAALTGSPQAAFQAFGQHPLVGSIRVAAGLVDGYRDAIPEVAAVLDRP